MFIAESIGEKKIKLNIWRRYEQERSCLVHFLCLLAVWWPGAQSTWDNYLLACNFAEYLPNQKKILIDSVTDGRLCFWLAGTRHRSVAVGWIFVVLAGTRVGQVSTDGWRGGAAAVERAASVLWSEEDRRRLVVQGPNLQNILRFIVRLS